LNYAEIYWADLPPRGGHVQSGRRPVIIWQDLARFRVPTILVIPLTSQQRMLKYGGGGLIAPSTGNGLLHPSVALVFQLGAVDARWIGTRIGRLDDPDLAAIQQLAKDLQMLP